MCQFIEQLLRTLLLEFQMVNLNHQCQLNYATMYPTIRAFITNFENLHILSYSINERVLGQKLSKPNILIESGLY